MLSSYAELISKGDSIVKDTEQHAHVGVLTYPYVCNVLTIIYKSILFVITTFWNAASQAQSLFLFYERRLCIKRSKNAYFWQL